MPHAFDLRLFHFATEVADPDFTECLFDGSPAEIITLLNHNPSISMPADWTYIEVEEVDEIIWIGEYVQRGARRVLSPIPCSLESHLIVEKLLDRSGDAVELLSGVVPYCGGYYLLGEFVVNPEVSLSPGDGDGWGAEEISEQLIAGKIHGQTMTGFALDSEGVWREHTWVITEDGKVVEADGPHSSFYGVRLSDERTVRFIELHRQERG